MALRRYRNGTVLEYVSIVVPDDESADGGLSRKAGDCDSGGITVGVVERNHKGGRIPRFGRNYGLKLVGCAGLLEYSGATDVSIRENLHPACLNRVGVGSVGLNHQNRSRIERAIECSDRGRARGRLREIQRRR